MTRSDSEGHPVHREGLETFLGLNIVQVPSLSPSMVYDSSRCYLVLGNDPEVSLHDDWEHDAGILMIKARANVGVPVKAQAIRKLNVASGASDSGETRAAQPRKSVRP